MLYVVYTFYPGQLGWQMSAPSNTCWTGASSPTRSRQRLSPSYAKMYSVHGMPCRRGTFTFILHVTCQRSKLVWPRIGEEVSRVIKVRYFTFVPPCTYCYRCHSGFMLRSTLSTIPCYANSFRVFFNTFPPVYFYH